MTHLPALALAAAAVALAPAAARADTPANAARITAASDPDCTALGDFYWEIGDADGVLGGGQIGTRYARTTSLPIASASKIVFGAYVVERMHGALTAAQRNALRMMSGYHGLNALLCAAAPTVAACLAAGPGDNYVYTAGEVGRFHYDGAHAQYLAVHGLGLGAMTAAQLTAEVNATLGLATGFAFTSPQPSGGMASSAAQFAGFLRAILAGDLALADHLGEAPVCTLRSPICNAVASPSPFAWHYSYHHWIEDDAAGDGAFSSPGAFGFYPWISADRALYGILARDSAAGGGIDSVRCGQKLRAAWRTGRPQ